MTAMVVATTTLSLNFRTSRRRARARAWAEDAPSKAMAKEVADELLVDPEEETPRTGCRDATSSSAHGRLKKNSPGRRR